MKLFTLMCALILVACTEPPPAPTCRIAKAFNAEYAGPAGCLIRVQNSLLVIQHSSSGLYDLPYGNPISSGSALFPQESAQCTAHRHTWEQTGLNVEVDQLLGVTQSGMMLFSCAISGGFTSEDGPLPPPEWANNDILKIDFIDPFDSRHDVWEQADNLIMYRDGFVAHGEQKQIKTD